MKESLSPLKHPKTLLWKNQDKYVLYDEVTAYEHSIVERLKEIEAMMWFTSTMQISDNIQRCKKLIAELERKEE